MMLYLMSEFQLYQVGTCLLMSPNGIMPQIRITVRLCRGLQMLKRIFSRENLYAVGLCLIILLVIIMSADSAPQWIYQGF